MSLEGLSKSPLVIRQLDSTKKHKHSTYPQQLHDCTMGFRSPGTCCLLACRGKMLASAFTPEMNHELRAYVRITVLAIEQRVDS